MKKILKILPDFFSDLLFSQKYILKSPSVGVFSVGADFCFISIYSDNI